MNIKAWLNFYSALLLLYNYGLITRGAVMISHSETVQVCKGDNLELTCNVTGTILAWTFTLIGNSYRPFTSGIQASGPAEEETFPLTIDNMTIIYTISRSSAEDSPVSSRLLISAITNSHNGTEIACSDVVSGTESSTTIVITGSLIQDPEVNRTEEFGTDGITVTLEWAQENSYNITTTPYLPLNFSGSESAQIKVRYNTLYNVSVLGIPPICGQIDSVFELYYASCRNIVNQTDESIRVHGYMNPAVEEASVTFSCPPGLVLTGPKTSTCMRNGEWEPGPQHLKCLARCNPPPPPSNGQLLPYLSTLEGATVVYVCLSTYKRGQGNCEEVNVTAVCNKQGHWEPSTEDICAEPRGSLLSEGGIIAVASSVITLIVSSLVSFTFGYLCRHCRQKQTRALPIPVINRTPVYENVVPEQNTEQDMELKENVAYGPIMIVS